MAQPNMPNPTFLSQLTDEEKRGHSYQYAGYPELSRWMASSQDFFLLRRYSALAARSLLYLQHRIAKIEIELTNLDEKSMMNQDGYAGIDTIDHDTEPGRQILIDQALPLLQQYCTSKVLLFAVHLLMWCNR